MATENAVISSFDILLRQVFLLQSDPLHLEAPRRVVKSGEKKTAVVQTGRKHRGERLVVRGTFMVLAKNDHH